MDQTSQGLQKSTQDHDPSATRADRDYRWSEAFRAACEARYVLSKPLPERKQYLAGVGAARGAVARQYLERVILQEWKKKATPKSG